MVGGVHVCRVCMMSNVRRCLLLKAAFLLGVSSLGVSRMKDLDVPQVSGQLSYVMDSVTFAHLTDADSSEGRMLVKKEEVARLRWQKEEMALKT